MRGLLLGGALAFVACGSAVAGQWTYRELSDPITDAKRGIAVLDGDGGHIIVKCDESGPDSIYVELLSDKFLGAVENASRPVIMRLDDGAPTSTVWVHDKDAAIVMDPSAAASIAQSVASAKKLAFRLTTYESEQVDIVATADGDDSVVRHAFTTCGEPYPASPRP